MAKSIKLTLVEGRWALLLKFWSICACKVLFKRRTFTFKVLCLWLWRLFGHLLLFRSEILCRNLFYRKSWSLDLIFGVNLDSIRLKLLSWLDIDGLIYCFFLLLLVGFWTINLRRLPKVRTIQKGSIIRLERLLLGFRVIEHRIKQGNSRYFVLLLFFVPTVTLRLLFSEGFRVRPSFRCVASLLYRLLLLGRVRSLNSPRFLLQLGKDVIHIHFHGSGNGSIARCSLVDGEGALMCRLLLGLLDHGLLELGDQLHRIEGTCWTYS